MYRWVCIRLGKTCVCVFITNSFEWVDKAWNWKWDQSSIWGKGASCSFCQFTSLTSWQKIGTKQSAIYIFWREKNNSPNNLLPIQMYRSFNTDIKKRNASLTRRNFLLSRLSFLVSIVIVSKLSFCACPVVFNKQNRTELH